MQGGSKNCERSVLESRDIVFKSLYAWMVVYNNHHFFNPKRLAQVVKSLGLCGSP